MEHPDNSPENKEALIFSKTNQSIEKLEELVRSHKKLRERSKDLKEHISKINLDSFDEVKKNQLYLVIQEEIEQFSQRVGNSQKIPASEMDIIQVIGTHLTKYLGEKVLHEIQQQKAACEEVLTSVTTEVEDFQTNINHLYNLYIRKLNQLISSLEQGIQGFDDIRNDYLQEKKLEKPEGFGEVNSALYREIKDLKTESLDLINNFNNLINSVYLPNAELDILIKKLKSLEK